MTDEAIFQTGKAILAKLPELLGPGAPVFEARLRALLREAAEGRNVDSRLLAALYGEPAVAKAAARTLERRRRAVESGRGQDFAADSAGDSSLRFSVWQPKQVFRDEWSDLLAYVYVPDAIEEVLEDSRRVRGGESNELRKGRASKLLPKGTEITATPRLSGCRFNPPQATILWLEDWHRVFFRMQIEPGADVSDGESRGGMLELRAGAALLGEVPLLVDFAAEAGPDPSDVRYQTLSACSKVFCSYSHLDSPIVERAEPFYAAIGHDYWRDWRKLRSGQRWREEIRKAILDADIFQLFWSRNAEESEEVEVEWTIALELGSEGFVRPVYWGTDGPEPRPPDRLAALHFARLPDV